MGAKGATILSLFAIMGVLFLVQVARAESNQSSNHDSIDDRDLLQADATIIAGILILLTVSAIKDEARLSYYSFIVLSPFAISITFLITGAELGTTLSPIFSTLARFLTVLGAIMLIIVIALITRITRIAKYLEIAAQNKKELEKEHQLEKALEKKRDLIRQGIETIPFFAAAAADLPDLKEKYDREYDRWKYFPEWVRQKTVKEFARRWQDIEEKGDKPDKDGFMPGDEFGLSMAIKEAERIMREYASRKDDSASS
jgi:hypothetical protein